MVCLVYVKWIATFCDVTFRLLPELPAGYFLAANRYEHLAIFVTLGGFQPLSVSWMDLRKGRLFVAVVVLFFFLLSLFFLWHDILTLIRKKFPVTCHQLCLWERSLWQIRFSLQMCKLHGILQLSRYYNPIHFQILKDRLPQLEQKNTARRNFIYDAVTSKLACKWRISSLYILYYPVINTMTFLFFKKITVICWVIST